MLAAACGLVSGIVGFMMGGAIFTATWRLISKDKYLELNRVMHTSKRRGRITNVCSALAPYETLILMSFFFPSYSGLEIKKCEVRTKALCSVSGVVCFREVDHYLWKLLLFQELSRSLQHRV
jgi:hypothetical protein